MTGQVRDISEFDLIDRLRSALPPAAREHAGIAIGIGDDAAVWRPEPGCSVIVTTDSLVDTVHFRLDWTTWEDLGWKSLAVNISDIAAMGGMPAVATVSLALTGDERITDLEALYRGMGAIAVQEGVALAGGDIVRTPHDFGIHVTLLGTAPAGRVLTRSKAQPGDVIVVTGTLGAAAAGLRLLSLSPEDPRRRAATMPLLIEAHTRPRPRVAAGRFALAIGAHAGMDLSDGLAGDLPKILQASHVDAIVDLEALPILAAVRALFPDQAIDLALRGGEDYELLLTMAPDRFASFAAGLDERGGAATIIGEIVPPSGSKPQMHVRDATGTTIPLAAGAFDHFRRDSS